MNERDSNPPVDAALAARAAAWRETDAQAAQEARRYGSPLPSRHFLIELLADCTAPLGSRTHQRPP